VRNLEKRLGFLGRAYGERALRRYHRSRTPLTTAAVAARSARPKA
jgi:hypothetical protein